MNGPAMLTLLQSNLPLLVIILALGIIVGRWMVGRRNSIASDGETNRS